jgi:amino acid transporter
MLKKFKRILIGKPLASNQMAHELIPKRKGLPVLASDALSSVSYATEEILMALIAFGALAMNWSFPIALGILVVLAIVTLSYRQTISSYPNGGGAYTVAKENLGPLPGLIAGGSLMVDYVLTVAVSVAAGVENLASAIPFFREHLVLTGVIVVLILMVLSLRGMSESSTIFAFPCYFFIFSVVSLVIAGLWQAINGAEVKSVGDIVSQPYPELSLFLILRAFSSGCTALTGVEAISNGVQIFREPKAQNAKITLTVMAVLLGAMFLGVTYLAHIFHLAPIPEQTLISQLGKTIFGNSLFYYLLQAATCMILFLAASTSYADFPRLSSLLAKDRFAPRQLAILGDRLVFSNGIIGLSFAAILLLIIFGGRTHHLIPLYAVGVFTSFTLSQSGMVVHHLRHREKAWRASMLFNGLGALCTFVVLIVIAVSKFSQGAFVVVIILPLLVNMFFHIHRHYLDFAKELSDVTDRNCSNVTTYDETLLIPQKPKQVVILPISGLHQGVVNAYNYSNSISHDVRVCFVEIDEQQTLKMQADWRRLFGQELIVLKSPYRSVVDPFIRYVDKVLRTEKVDFVTVVFPEFVTAKWYHQFLHNQTAFVIKAALIFKPKVIVTSVRYHLHTT